MTAQKALETLAVLAKESPLALRAYGEVMGLRPEYARKFQPGDMALVHSLSDPEAMIDTCRKAHAGDEAYNNATQRDYGNSMKPFVVALSIAFHDALGAQALQGLQLTEGQRQVCRDLIQLMELVGRALSSIPLPKKPLATRSARATRRRKAVAA